MAFRKDQTGVAQTAANTAATLVAAAITAGVITDIEAAKTEFDALRASTFEDLKAVVEADNVVFAEAEANAPARSTGGGSSGGDKTYAPPTLEKSLETDLSFGKFKGVTLGELVDMAASECSETYGYTTGNGIKYLQYLSKLDKVEEGKKPNPFIASRALVILEAQKAKAE